MSTTTRTVAAGVDRVWDVLADGWLYPLWVVGASRMREVDDTWPAVGSRLHHSAGSWPLLVDDTTEVVDVEPGSMLSLRARGWPMGEAHVVIRLRAAGGATEVVLVEDVASGPGRLAPKPLRDAGIGWRNVESLRRLAYVSERRAG